MVEKFYWPLGDEPLRERKPFKDVCAERAADARARITRAMAFLRFENLGIKELAIALVKNAGCSQQTLYKYPELWHPNPDQLRQRVTDAVSGVRDELAEVQRLVRESLESVGITSVTHKGGENEVCSLNTPPSKNLTPEGEKRGCGGEKGISTGWLPPLDWKEGAVDDL
jgi:hypothetical protein